MMKSGVAMFPFLTPQMFRSVSRLDIRLIKIVIAMNDGHIALLPGFCTALRYRLTQLQLQSKQIAYFCDLR